MQDKLEDYFKDALIQTTERQYFVCRRFDILLRKHEGKFYPAINSRNLIFIQMSVSAPFFETVFLNYNPNED